MEVSGELHARAYVPEGKNPQYPLGRKLGGPQSCSGCATSKYEYINVIRYFIPDELSNHSSH
jgi:hypothetical protein